MFKYITDAVDAIADSKFLANIEDKVLAKFEKMSTKAPVAPAKPVVVEVVKETV